MSVKPDLIERREASARIIEPREFAFLDRHGPYVHPETVSGHQARQAAYAKADQIEALYAHEIERLREAAGAFIEREEWLREVLDLPSPPAARGLIEAADKAQIAAFSDLKAALQPILPSGGEDE